MKEGEIEKMVGKRRQKKDNMYEVEINKKQKKGIENRLWERKRGKERGREKDKERKRGREKGKETGKEEEGREKGKERREEEKQLMKGRQRLKFSVFIRPTIVNQLSYFHIFFIMLG